MLDSKSLIRTQSAVDQENAAISDLFKCEEYLRILISQVNDRIWRLYKMIDDPRVQPESDASLSMNVVDLINVLRVAQVKLAEVLLNSGKDAETDDQLPDA